MGGLVFYCSSVAFAQFAAGLGFVTGQFDARSLVGEFRSWQRLNEVKGAFSLWNVYECFSFIVTWGAAKFCTHLIRVFAFQCFGGRHATCGTYWKKGAPLILGNLGLESWKYRQMTHQDLVAAF